MNLSFSLCSTTRIQHCKSRGVLNENADPECRGCSSVRSCRSATAETHATFPPPREKHLVPRTRSGPLDHHEESRLTPQSESRPVQRLRISKILHFSMGADPSTEHVSTIQRSTFRGCGSSFCCDYLNVESSSERHHLSRRGLFMEGVFKRT